MTEEKFPVTIESLSQIQDLLNKWCEDSEISMKIATKIAVCTDEIVSNIVYYSGAEYLHIQCTFENEMISISFIDNGKAFNPLTDSAEPDINASAEERKIGGLGIYMVKKMMDNVQYSRQEDKNVLTISIKK